ncbi:hypothetical protein HID58_084441 [Brassica napus]|uniref:Acyl carrier protein n=1 Tax=Brassica napus TaxID=3708 RepID=A0ABQ7XJQ5_BRANA|nr:hypothetical protein HID58_084441 [Brassica napus]
MATSLSSSISMQARVSATTRRFCLQKPGSIFNNGKTNLSFTLQRSIPARLVLSCSVREARDSGESQEPSLPNLELIADSLDTVPTKLLHPFVEIVMGLEEEFGITMAEERAKEIATVQHAAELIEELIQQKTA